MDQTIQNPHGISTFGSCVVRVEPDYATVDFSVFRIEETPAAALAAARSTVSGISSFLSKSGIDDRSFKSGGLTLEPWTVGVGADEQLVGYRAVIDCNLKIASLDKVDAVLVGIIAAGANEVHAISYRTTRLREVRAEARQGALLAALKKAEMYSEAAGVAVGRTIHIEEIDPYSLDVDLDEIDEFQTSGTYNPGSVAIAAAVRVSFTLKGGKMASATGQFVAFDP